MKKTLSLALALVLSLAVCAAAFAVDEGGYAWGDWTITVTGVDGKSMYAPADMAEDHQSLMVSFSLPTALWQDEALCAALKQQARLVGESGAIYAASTSMRGVQKPTLAFLFAVPKGTEADALTLTFVEPSVPEEYVGQWAGSAGNISLRFDVDAEGKGSYTFEQAGYTESYPFTMTVESETFAVEIPKDNELGIVTCEGTYAYADGVLTLDVVTTFAGGTDFTYSIPCERVEGK